MGEGPVDQETKVRRIKRADLWGLQREPGIFRAVFERRRWLARSIAGGGLGATPAQRLPAPPARDAISSSKKALPLGCVVARWFQVAFEQAQRALGLELVAPALVDARDQPGRPGELARRTEEAEPGARVPLGGRTLTGPGAHDQRAKGKHDEKSGR